MPLFSPTSTTSPVAPAPPRAEAAGLSPHVAVALLIVVTTLGRAWAASAIHLTEDEAYYRLWAARLHAGYYDHPPMIAWWIRLGVTLLGDTALGARLMPILGCALSTWLIFDFVRAAGAAPRTAWRAAFWWNATLLVGFGGLLATPDAPASLFWIATLWALARATRASKPATSLSFWGLAGAAAGLGVLSKYSALFLGPGVLLWLASSAEGRARLLRPGPWLALAAAAAAVAPNLVWNATHGWVTVIKQFGRIRPEHLALQHLPEFLFVQAILLNPLVTGYAVLGAVDVARRRSSLGDAGRLAALSGAPFAGYLALHALHASVQAHWPVPLYAGAALLAAAAAETRPRALGFVPLGFVLSSLALIHLAVPRTDVGRLDPSLPLRGWPRFAAAVDARARAANARWIGTVSYGTLAQLDDERLRTPALQLDERRRYDGLPQLDAAELGGRGLVLDLARRVDPADLTACFATVEEVDALERGANSGPVERYRAFIVGGPRTALPREGCITGKDRRARRAR